MTLRERDIRPQGAMETLVSSAHGCLAELGDSREMVACPACGGQGTPDFMKDNFRWNVCEGCGSLFVSPRPSRENLTQFHERLDAFGPFYEASAEARRESILMPRAQMIADLAGKHGIHGTYCDIGCGSAELISMVRAFNVFGAYCGIEPSADMASAAQKRGIAVAVYSAESAPMWLTAGLATAFEVLEHVFSPEKFMRSARRILVPGGILVFTTLTADGWDILELWQHHKSVCPPLHLNLMSIKGLEVLVSRAGMELLGLSTPGQLDVDIVKNALTDQPSIPTSRFARQIVSAPEDVRGKFQSFLNQNRLSSHVMVVARRPMTDG